MNIKYLSYTINLRMRLDVIDELNRRIDKLRLLVKPNDIMTGMTGSFVLFNYAIDSYSAMTDEEWDDNVYDDYLKTIHMKIYKEVNGICD
jgi:hypothetical protein